MNTCKDCKYWGAYRLMTSDVVDPQLGVCGGIPLKDMPADRVVTGPDFGCIHWTAKA